MQRQGSFSQAEYAAKKKRTRRDKFLAEMEQVVPWARLVERLQPLYPTGKRGRPPIGLERMLRLYFVQQWYGLADEASGATARIRKVGNPEWRKCGVEGTACAGTAAARLRLGP